MNEKGVTVVAPVYNNAGTLDELCRRVRTAIVDRPIEVILVDDRSTDGSLEVIERLGVRAIAHGRNRGQNAAILTALAQATEPLACILDADLEDPPEAIPLLLAPLDGGTASVVFSSRDEARRLTSRLFRLAVRRLFPSLPSHPCLCFAIDEAGRTALVTAAREDDYLPAVIGALRLRCAQVEVPRGRRPHGRTGYPGMKRVRYAAAMLTAALRVWWRAPTGR